jgi:hypothetical protein
MNQVRTISYSCGHQTPKFTFGGMTVEQADRMQAGMQKRECLDCQATAARKRNRRAAKYHRHF